MKNETTKNQLKLGRLTSDFFPAKTGHLYEGPCCCCCCCLMWIGGLVGTVAGGIAAATAKSRIRGKDYRKIMIVFWLTFITSNIFLGFLSMANPKILFSIIGFPITNALTGIFFVVIYSYFSNLNNKEVSSALKSCALIFIATIFGYALGFLAMCFLGFE